MLCLSHSRLKSEKNILKSACSNNLIGYGNILIQIFLIFLTYILFHYFFNHITIENSIFYILSLIFIGTRMRALGNIMHECSHFTFVPQRKKNRQIGTFISILDLSSFKKYQKSHLSHHRYLGSAKKDTDYKTHLILISKFKKTNIFHHYSLLFLCVILNPLHWFFYFLNSFSFNENNKKIVLFKIIYLSFSLFLSLCISSHNYFYFVVVPFLTTYQLMKIASDFLDHHNSCFLEKYNTKTRNHIFKYKILNIIFFPRNDCYHLVHHLYPLVPTTELKKFHSYLLTHDKEYFNRNHKIF